MERLGSFTAFGLLWTGLFNHYWVRALALRIAHPLAAWTTLARLRARVVVVVEAASPDPPCP
eukprot:SAG31_NODE_39216_length_290_cov_0.722513_1_plen_61_part_10